MKYTQIFFVYVIFKSFLIEVFLDVAASTVIHQFVQHAVVAIITTAAVILPPVIR